MPQALQHINTSQLLISPLCCCHLSMQSCVYYLIIKSLCLFSICLLNIIVICTIDIFSYIIFSCLQLACNGWISGKTFIGGTNNAWMIVDFSIINLNVWIRTWIIASLVWSCVIGASLYAALWRLVGLCACLTLALFCACTYLKLLISCVCY